MSVEVLSGLIAVKDLEIRYLKERINQLEVDLVMLDNENRNLYTLLEKKKKVVGFKRDEENC